MRTQTPPLRPQQQRLKELSQNIANLKRESSRKLIEACELDAASSRSHNAGEQERLRAKAARLRDEAMAQAREMNELIQQRNAANLGQLADNFGLLRNN